MIEMLTTNTVTRNKGSKREKWIGGEVRIGYLLYSGELATAPPKFHPMKNHYLEE